MLDELMNKLGLQYEELSEDEKKQYNEWYRVLQENGGLTLGNIKDYIEKMKLSVENELTSPTVSKENDLFLKARLRNYMLLEAFLDTPEKARKALERQIKNK